MNLIQCCRDWFDVLTGPSLKHKDEFELSLEECLHLRLCVAVLDGDYAHIVPIPAILASFSITPITPPGHQHV